jgi:hypothetical protein
MVSRKITAIDVCEVTGYSRSQLRWLLEELPPYCKRKPAPRVARVFTPQDLSILSVIFLLENTYGMRRDAVIQVAELIGDALSGPKEVSSTSRLLISVIPLHVTYVDVNLDGVDGIFVSLDPVFSKVDGYLRPVTLPNQVDLNFGPGLFNKKLASNTRHRS